jgi:hypothetical protein
MELADNSGRPAKSITDYGDEMELVPTGPRVRKIIILNHQFRSPLFLSTTMRLVFVPLAILSTPQQLAVLVNF